VCRKGERSAEASIQIPQNRYDQASLVDQSRHSSVKEKTRAQANRGRVDGSYAEKGGRGGRIAPCAIRRISKGDIRHRPGTPLRQGKEEPPGPKKGPHSAR